MIFSSSCPGHVGPCPYVRRVSGTSETYTRRRLGGRQPLCGIGVTSRIDVTTSPTACSARSADSRPEPGPETSTSRVRMPCSTAFLAASSAAICAAYGVDLREPLKPIMPADDQDTVLPCVSVMVTMVLLKVAATWATPTTTFFFSFLRARGALPAGFCASAIYLVTFFMPAIALAGPLRVRALV